MEPTLFADVDNSMTIAREEIFGPVLSLIPYDSVDDAVAIANDSDYGLAGAVYTADVDAGIDIARRVRTGTFAVNTMQGMDFNGPFGGFKQSGIGRELGPEGLHALLRGQDHLAAPGSPDRRRRLTRRPRAHRPPRGGPPPRSPSSRPAEGRVSPGPPRPRPRRRARPGGGSR